MSDTFFSDPAATAVVAAALCLLLAAIFGFLSLRGVRRTPNGAVALFVTLVGAQMLGYALFRRARTDEALLLWARYVTAFTVVLAPSWLALVRAACGKPSARVIAVAGAAALLLVALTPTAWMMRPEIIEWNLLGAPRHPRPGPLHVVHFLYAWATVFYGAVVWIIEIRKRGAAATGVSGRVLPIVIVAAVPVGLSIVNLLNYVGVLPHGTPIEFIALGFVLTLATVLLEAVVATHKHLETEHERVLALNEQIEQSRARERELAAKNQQLLKEEIRYLREELGGTREGSRLVGTSAAVRQLQSLITRVAPRDTTVLITGETGSGKELVARELHGQSERAEKPFVAVNVAAMPETLLESELFGHVAGAFTGAEKSRTGIFERADGGTLFLDEIGEASAAVQTKLLRVLQERVVTRVGGHQDIPVDVRLIAATHRDLEKLQSEGRFRQDLFYRLNVISLDVPPLRERPEDIPLLATHFLRRFTEEQKRPIRGFSRETLSLLSRYAWPGNVRELENAVEHAVAMADADLILPADLPATVQGTAEGAGDGAPLPSLPGLLADEPTISELERRYIYEMLERCGGNKTEAAKRLGINQATLYRRLKSYGQS